MARFVTDQRSRVARALVAAGVIVVVVGFTSERTAAAPPVAADYSVSGATASSGAGTTTFTWTLVNPSAPGETASHVTIGTCLGDTATSTSPSATYGPDPTTGVTGYKWDGVPVGSTMSLTFDGAVADTGVAMWGVKKGSGSNTGTAAGPACAAAPTTTVPPTTTTVLPTTTTVLPTTTTTTGAAPAVTPTTAPLVGGSPGPAPDPDAGCDEVSGAASGAGDTGGEILGRADPGCGLADVLPGADSDAPTSGATPAVEPGAGPVADPDDASEEVLGVLVAPDGDGAGGVDSGERARGLPADLATTGPASVLGYALAGGSMVLSGLGLHFGSRARLSRPKGTSDRRAARASWWSAPSLALLLSVAVMFHRTRKSGRA